MRVIEIAQSETLSLYNEAECGDIIVTGQSFMTIVLSFFQLFALHCFLQMSFL